MTNKITTHSKIRVVVWRFEFDRVQGVMIETWNNKDSNYPYFVANFKDCRCFCINLEDSDKLLDFCRYIHLNHGLTTDPTSFSILLHKQYFDNYDRNYIETQLEETMGKDIYDVLLHSSGEGAVYDEIINPIRQELGLT